MEVTRKIEMNYGYMITWGELISNLNTIADVYAGLSHALDMIHQGFSTNMEIVIEEDW